jgi:hypothetical protein
MCPFEEDQFVAFKWLLNHFAGVAGLKIHHHNSSLIRNNFSEEKPRHHAFHIFMVTRGHKKNTPVREFSQIIIR